MFPSSNQGKQSTGGLFNLSSGNNQNTQKQPQKVVPPFSANDKQKQPVKIKQNSSQNQSGGSSGNQFVQPSQQFLGGTLPQNSPQGGFLNSASSSSNPSNPSVPKSGVVNQSSSGNTSSNPSSSVPSVGNDKDKRPSETGGNVLHQPKSLTQTLTVQKQKQNEKRWRNLVRDDPLEGKRSRLDFRGIFVKLKYGEDLSKNEIQMVTTNYCLVYKNKDNRYKELKPEHIKIDELQGIGSQQKAKMTEFWTKVVQYLLQKNPQICMQAGIQLMKNHIKYNRQMYYPQGKYNTKLFIQQNAFFTQNKKLLGVNERSSFFKNIISDIQKDVNIFNHQVRAVLALLPSPIIFNIGQQYVKNIWHSFKIVTDLDHHRPFQTSVKTIIVSLAQAYAKLPQLFSQKLVQDMFVYIDKHFQILPEDSIERIKELLCKFVFEYPFTMHKWSPQLLKITKNIKNVELYPFKWFPQTVEKKNARWLSNFFYIEGSYWLPLAASIIENCYEYTDDENVKNFIFYLVCSIIKSNAVDFWRQEQKYYSIYRYIQLLGEEDEEIGKLLKIMICTMQSKEDENGEWLAKQVYNYFANTFLSEANKRQFYEKNVIKTSREKVDPNITQNPNGQIQQRYLQDKGYNSREFIMKLLIKYPSIYEKLCDIYSLNSSAFLYEITIGYLHQIKEYDHEHIKLIFKLLNVVMNEKSFESTRLLFFDYITRNSKQQQLYALFENILYNKSNIQPFSQHIISLVKLQKCEQYWFKLLTNVLQGSIRYWDNQSLQYYANIISSVLIKRTQNKQQNINITLMPDFFTSFICWGLKMEQETDERGKFLNLLIKRKQYKVLSSILNLIQSFMLFQIADSSSLPQRIKRFWSMRNMEIQIDNNKTTSLLPAIISIVLLSLPNSENTEHEKICQKCLSILTLLHTKDKNELDFNIYENNFINEHEKIYIQMRKPLQQHLLGQLKANVNSSLSGQYIDLITQAKFFNFQSIRKVIDNRIERIGQQQHNSQIVAYSRYIISYVHQSQGIIEPSNKNIVKSHLINIMDLIVQRIRKLLQQEKQDVVMGLESNFWKIVTVIQVNNKDFMVQVLKRYFPLIISSTNILKKKKLKQSKKYELFQQDYIKMLELVLGCKAYLLQRQYYSLMQFNNLGPLLLRFIHHIVKIPQFHLCLYYGLQMYEDTKPENRLKELKLINSIVIEEIKKQDNHNDSIKTVALLMYLSNQCKEVLPPSIINTTHSPILYSFEDVYSKEQVIPTITSNIHPMNFISSCHYLYKVIINKQQDIEGFGIIVKVLQTILKNSIQDYKYGWIYHLLNAILCSSISKTLILKVSDLVFKSDFIYKMGQFINAYIGSHIKWPYKMDKTINKMDLLDKQVFLIMMKFMSTFMALKESWMDIHPQHYNSLCLAFSQCSILLQTNHHVHPSTQYQYLLSEVKPSQFAQKHNPRELQHINKVYDDIKNALQLIDQHLNTMIKEKYVMTLLSVFENNQVTTLNYHDIMAITNKTIHKLMTFQKYKSYLRVLGNLDKEVWTSYRLSKELYYLNIIQEPLQNQQSVLNTLLDVSLECSLQLKELFQLHKQYRKFKTLFSENMSLLKKASKIVKIQVDSYFQISGMDMSKSYKASGR